MASTYASSGTSLEIRRTFSAPREKVFAAWTQKGPLEQWMCKDIPTQNPKYVELDVRPGGRYVIEIPLPDGDLYRGEGVYREVTPPERLVFTWRWSRVPDKPDPQLQAGDSVITIVLIEHGGSTEMIFTHEGFETEAIKADHQKGWDGCFRKLAEVLAAG